LNNTTVLISPIEQMKNSIDRDHSIKVISAKPSTINPTKMVRNFPEFNKSFPPFLGMTLSSPILLPKAQ